MVDETKDVRRPGEGGTPEKGMHAGKDAMDATGQNKNPGNDRTVDDREPSGEGGLPGQGTQAGKIATGAERGQDR